MILSDHAHTLFDILPDIRICPAKWEPVKLQCGPKGTWALLWRMPTLLMVQIPRHLTGERKEIKGKVKKFYQG